MSYTSDTAITASLTPTITTSPNSITTANPSQTIADNPIQTVAAKPIHTIADNIQTVAANPIQTIAVNPTLIITVSPSPTLTAMHSNQQVPPFPVGAIIGASVGAAAVLCIILLVIVAIIVAVRYRILAPQKSGSGELGGHYNLQESPAYTRCSYPSSNITEEVASNSYTNRQSDKKQFHPAVKQATGSVQPDRTCSQVATHHLTPRPRAPAGGWSGVESGGGATGRAGGLPPVHTYTTAAAAAAAEFDSSVDPICDTLSFTDNTQPDHTYWDVNDTGLYEDISEGNRVNAGDTSENI